MYAFDDRRFIRIVFVAKWLVSEFIFAEISRAAAIFGFSQNNVSLWFEIKNEFTFSSPDSCTYFINQNNKKKSWKLPFTETVFHANDQTWNLLWLKFT